MNNMTRHTITTLLAGVGFLTTALTANAAYYPAVGDLFYNGAYHLDSYMGWSPVGPFSVSKPSYEHDLWVHDSNFFITTCTSFSNLPSAYDDCNTAGIFDPNGPVFSFGTFNAKAISSANIYFGGWNFTSHGTATTSPFNLQGQENENRCLGIPSNLCMFSTQTHNLIAGWYMNWGGAPTLLGF